ncbi:MAG: helix-hairpin-helix domain-containing protein [Fibrobacteres bacterium]|nr:helix-hairpin-helix domain-containing protein [Fibrobacterota bacterium]
MCLRITKNTAKEIVQYRDKEGAFKTRDELRKVKGFGPKSFEQAAGFLRLAEGENPLDRSAVHPERYALVEKIAKTADLGFGTDRQCRQNPPDRPGQVRVRRKWVCPPSRTSCRNWKARPATRAPSSPTELRPEGLQDRRSEAGMQAGRR